MTSGNKYAIIINVASAMALWKHSSAGRALALQARGHRFEPCCFHQNGPVVQLVRTLACHARGRGFESLPGRHTSSPGMTVDREAIYATILQDCYASVAQLVEQGTENPRVVGSIPTGGTICGFSSFGRARPCQGRGGGFEPRNPLQKEKSRKRLFLFVFLILLF